MSTFNPHEGGTPATAWDGLLAGLPQLPMPGGGARLVVLAAHPDDETLGCGGLLADAARAGADITVLLATDGEASHPHSRTHRPPQLAAALEESVRGCSHLVTP